MNLTRCICDHCLVVKGKTFCHCSCSGAKAGGGDNLSRAPEERVRRYQDDLDALKRGFAP